MKRTWTKHDGEEIWIVTTRNGQELGSFRNRITAITMCKTLEAYDGELEVRRK